MSSSRPTTSTALSRRSAGWRALASRARSNGTPLSPELRERLSRRDAVARVRRGARGASDERRRGRATDCCQSRRAPGRVLFLATLFSRLVPERLLGRRRAASTSPTSSRCSSSSRSSRRGSASATGSCTPTASAVLGFASRFLRRLPVRLLQRRDDRRRSRSTARGWRSSLIHFAFLAAGIAHLARRSERFYWRTLGWFVAGFAANAVYGLFQLAARPDGPRTSTALVLNPITGGAASINIWGAVGESNVYRVNALTGRREPPRRHAHRPAAAPDARLPAARARPPVARAARGRCSGSCSLVELATLSRSGLLGLAVGGADARDRLPARCSPRARCSSLSAPSRRCSRCSSAAGATTSRTSCDARLQTGGSVSTLHFQVYDFIPQTMHAHPLFGFGLNTFSVYFEFVTGRTQLGRALVLRRDARRDRARRDALFALFLVYLFQRLGAAREIGRAPRRRGRSAGGPGAAARVGPDRRARGDDRGQRLLPDDAVLLLLRARPARARGADRVRPPGRAALKVAVLTTSYPAPRGDVAGRFVADAVERISASEASRSRSSRRRGSATTGSPTGTGSPANLRSRPQLALALPLMLGGFARAARRAARAADLVHAHWLPAGAVAMRPESRSSSRLCGTDVELARAAPALARPVLSRAQARDRTLERRSPRTRARSAPETCGRSRTASSSPTGTRRGGRPARDPLRGPALAGEGRARARRGRRRPSARRRRRRAASRRGAGRARLRPARRARAAVRSRGRRRLPSRREGFGVVCAEAMAHAQARRRESTSAACATSSSTARPAFSSRRATLPRCAMRSSGCSETQSSGAGSARRGGPASPSTSPGSSSPTTPLRAYEDALAKG